MNFIPLHYDEINMPAETKVQLKFQIVWNKV